VGATVARRQSLRTGMAAVEAGVGSIMPCYSSWNGVKVSGNKHLLTEILKQSNQNTGGSGGDIGDLVP